MGKFISIGTLNQVNIPEVKEQVKKQDPFETDPDISFLSSNQKQAINDCSEFYLDRELNKDTAFDMYLLNGQAGTGKSTVVNAFVHFMLNTYASSGIKICIAGLTHTAKDVLKTTSPIDFDSDSADPDEPVVLKYMTLHSLLNYKQKRTGLGANDVEFVKNKYSKNDITDYDIVIVDEASMLDNTLFKDLYLNRHKVCIILVGDGNQLPPVGQLGKSIVFQPHAQEAYRIHQHTLTTIYRQKGGSPIITSSQEVLRSYKTGGNNVLNSSNFVIQVNPEEYAKKTQLLKQVSKYYNPKYPFKYRVITFTNNAVKQYNNGIRNYIFDNPDILEPNEFIDIIGPYNKHIKEFDYEPVFHNRQQLQIVDYMYKEYTSSTLPFIVKDVPYLEVKVKAANGSTGIIPLLCEECEAPLKENIAFIKYQLQQINKKENPQKFKYQKRNLTINLERLYNLIVPFHYGYAGTTHSTQGRGYTSGIIDLEDLEVCNYTNPHIYQSLLYTAITRFKKSVIFSHKSFY